MNINQRIAAPDFIRDTIPYLFVAYPKEASVEALLHTKPEMISNTAAQHFNHPLMHYLKHESH